VPATRFGAIADQETRLAPHIGQDAVQQLLRATRLDVDLIYSLETMNKLEQG
jgi:hypothetical protein